MTQFSSCLSKQILRYFGIFAGKFCLFSFILTEYVIKALLDVSDTGGIFNAMLSVQSRSAVLAGVRARLMNRVRDEELGQQIIFSIYWVS